MGRLRARLSGLGVAAAMLLLLGLGAASQYSARMQADTETWVRHTHHVIETLYRMLGGLATAESCVRGYGLTHDDRLRQCFEDGLTQLREAETAVRTLTRDNTRQQQRLRSIEPLLARRLELLTTARNLADDRSRPFVVTAEAIDLTEQIRATALRMIETERALLDQRREEALRRASRTVGSTWAVLAGIVVMSGVAFISLAREMRRRTKAEREITLRHGEQRLLLNLAEMLQACRSLEESYEVILRLAPTIFSGQAGTLHLFRPSRDVLERHVAWGGIEPREGDMFPADECWALRRGGAHRVSTDTPAMYCKHIGAPEPAATLCLPMMGHGDVIGLLSLRSTDTLDDDARRLAALATEQISMALANMQLRETLRSQSIRDPLTGLFNRRYAEETLPRELHRAVREKTCVGILMVDVDHFKRFNDTFGHEAGDYVLKELATCLQQHTRKGDVISRMGGEEILVLLPGSDREHTLLKAEGLRAAVADLNLSHRGSPLGPITISIGVAVAPRDGESAEDVIRSADRALYRAKQSGRNRVVSSGADA